MDSTHTEMVAADGILSDSEMAFIDAELSQAGVDRPGSFYNELWAESKYTLSNMFVIACCRSITINCKVSL
jgi:hypothetical protein